MQRAEQGIGNALLPEQHMGTSADSLCGMHKQKWQTLLSAPQVPQSLNIKAIAVKTALALTPQSNRVTDHAHPAVCAKVLQSITV
jgi:hypothetical protein